MATVYSYLRFSDKAQEAGTSFARQKKLAEKWMQLHPEHNLDRTLKMTDLGASAHHKEHLELALGDFIAKAGAGLIEDGSILLLEKLDRFSRFDYQEAWELLRQVVKWGITIITLDPQFEINQKNIKDIGLMIQVMATFFAAEHESEKKSERLREAWNFRRENVSRERKLTCKSPAWLTAIYNKGPQERIVCTGYKIKPEAKKAIQAIFKWTIEGHGQKAILEKLVSGFKPITESQTKKRLNESTYTFDIVKTTIPKWTGSYIQKILSNRAVLGEFQQHRMIAGKKRKAIGTAIKNYYPRIISDKDFEKTQHIKQIKRKVRNKREEFINILAGLVFCTDGHPMHTVTTRTKRKKGEIYLQRRLTSYGHNLKQKGACPWAVNYFTLENLICESILEIDEETLLAKDIRKHEANAIEISNKQKIIKAFEKTLETADDPKTIKTVMDLLQVKNIELQKLEAESKLNRSLTKAERNKNVQSVKNLLEVLRSVSTDKQNDLRHKIQYLLPTIIDKIVLRPRKLPNNRVEADGNICLLNGEIRKVHLCDFSRTKVLRLTPRMKNLRLMIRDSENKVGVIATANGIITFDADKDDPESREDWNRYFGRYILDKYHVNDNRFTLHFEGVYLDSTWSKQETMEELYKLLVSMFCNVRDRIKRSNLDWNTPAQNNLRRIKDALDT